MIKQTADETARLLPPENKSARRNEPAGGSKLPVALSQRRCVFVPYIAMCETGSLQSPAPVLPSMAHNRSV